MAEKEKRRATTFVTSRGAIINVAAPSVYIAPGVTPVDVTNPTEMREALREEIVGRHITGAMLFPNYDLNRDFFLRVSGFGVRTELADVNDFLLDTTPPTTIKNAVLLEQYNAMYSKRLYKYGSFMHCVKVPLNTNPSWVTVYIGAESTGAGYGGVTYFQFTRGVTLVSIITLISINYVAIRQLDISALIVDPSSAAHRYYVKINRASAEYYVDATLVGIIQCVPESDTYNVRTTAPYVLAQIKGQMPTHQPNLLEIIATGVANIGTQPGFVLSSISVMDGDPAPPRTLHPITGGVNWEGTTIAAGTLTSDRIPIAGYDNKTISFIATGAGTLLVDVDYGDDSNDQYDSVAVAANTLITYIMTANPLWLRLRFTPTSYPCTVTRARVMMA